jgi:hypothetical protein
MPIGGRYRLGLDDFGCLADKGKQLCVSDRLRQCGATATEHEAVAIA